MTRSQINQEIIEAINFFKQHHYPLPDFAYWSPQKWHHHSSSAQEIIQTRLGWDITDFGSNNFSSVGRVIFTIRNGLSGSSTYPKPYAQKVMRLKEGQKSPLHYHQHKMEDIINVSGGKIAISFQSLTGNSVSISQDGRLVSLKASKTLLLSPGQSVCVPPKTIHEFYAKSGSGEVLSMEVSSVCDDLTDNIWSQKAERFPKISEDVPPLYYLCCDYQKFLPNH
jgi:D-lyxose ketol-isomerase